MTRCGIMYNQRDIVLIPIPFTDLSSKKRRPVVILSNDEYNMNKEDIVVAAITSNISDDKYSIHITERDVEEETLPRPSMIRADKLYTLNQSIVHKKFDRLEKKVFREVLTKIQTLFSSRNVRSSKMDGVHEIQ